MFKDWIRRMVREAFHEQHISPAPPNIHTDLQSLSDAAAVVYSIDNGYLLTIRIGGDHGHKAKMVHCAKIEDIGVELAKSSYLNRLQSPSTTIKTMSSGGGAGAAYPQPYLSPPPSTAVAPNVAALPTLMSNQIP